VNKDGKMTSSLSLNNSTPSLKHQIWRYFLSFLLTPDLNYLITLVIIMFFFVSMFERFMGNLCSGIVFFATNILYNFFAMAVFEGTFLVISNL
jgi:hypothetical protein